MNKREVKVRKWLGIMLALAMIVGMMPTAAFADDHVHQYVETVVEPTCTERGYTLHKCECGDEYKDAYTDPVPHDYGDDGYCKYGCGMYRAAAEEGSKFLYVEADTAGKITIVPQENVSAGGEVAYDHIIVPEGTRQVYVTYPENSIYADPTYGTTAAYPWNFSQNTTGGSFNPPAKVNSDGTIRVTLPISDYITVTPGKGIGVAVGLSVESIFTFEEKLPEGYYHVVKPNSSKYTVTGEDQATDGYTFTVEPKDGYEPGPNMKIKVNGEVVATEPGEITLDEVTENVFITIDDPDVIVKLDLTGWEGNMHENSLSRTKMQGWDMIEDNLDDAGIEAGKINELSFDFDDYDSWSLYIMITGPQKDVVGMNVNGELISGYYGGEDPLSYSFEKGSIPDLFGDYVAFGYGFSTLDWNTYKPDKELIAKAKGTYVIKPVFGGCEEHDFAPATCMEPETCTKCNMPKEGSTPDTENGHSWDEGKVTKEATIGEKGEMLYRCEHNVAHTKKEEIEKVDPADLNSLIADAEAAPEGIEVSENGAGLDYGTQFVTQADKDALDAAVAQAKAVAENDDSTQSDVDEAISDLGAAVFEFGMAVQEFTPLKNAENKVEALPKEIATSDKTAVEDARAALDEVDKESLDPYDQELYDFVEAKLEAAEAKLDAAEAKEELAKAKKEADEKVAEAEAAKKKAEEAKAASDANAAAKEAEAKKASNEAEQAKADKKAAEDKLAQAEAAKKAAEAKAAKAETALKKAKAEKVGKVKIKKVKGAKKKATVTWKKIKGAKGYEVIVAKNKKGTKNALTYSVKGNKAKRVIKKLKKGKYFVKVRAYKKYNSNMLYGSWSKAKKVKVK